MSEHRVTGSLIVVKRQSGPVYFLKARDLDGRQIKRRLGPVADWPRKAAKDALRDFLTDLGRVPDRRALDGLSRRGHFTAPDDRVFCTPTGGVLDEGQIRDTFYATLKTAGIDRDRGTGKRLVFHDLRHTFGTLAVQAFPLSDVQAYMGHANIATTMIYVHHTPQHAAADGLGELVASDPESSAIPYASDPERTRLQRVKR
jgi:integrase